MSDFEIRRDRHHDRLLGLDAELRGAISAVLEMVDEGRMTPERAITAIREKHAQTVAANESAWSEYLGGDR